MNNNKTFSTTSTINEDYMSFSYNDNYCSQPLLPFSPSSSINDLLIHSNTSNNHHQFLQAPSPYSQFEFVLDLPLLSSFHPQNIDQTITTTDHPSLLPLNNTTGESQLFEPSETITISTSHQDPKMKKVKKPSRTDRHSKITTARGTRDRRMRLSVDVAKELFGLQDMLGFDKASKTVEWLLTQAKPEIIKIATSLSNSHGGFSSGAESQLRPALGSTDTSSDLCELASVWTAEDKGSNTSMTENKVDGRTMRGKRKMSQPRKLILKERSIDGRVKARERAKDRTMEKMMKRRLQENVVEEVESHNQHDEVLKNDNNTDVNWTNSFEETPFREDVEELCKNNRFAAYNDFVVNKKDHVSDESYNMISKMNSSFPILTHHSSQGAATSIEHQHQVRDVHHFLGKPRDFIYNYHNMY